jgi:hypothetical protein
MIVALIAGLGIACAGKTQKRAEQLDYCTCELGA